MKLESFAIREAIDANEIKVAANLLLDHFGMSHIIGDIPSLTVLPKKTETRLLLWAGDYYYEWCSDTGFDSGCHDYPVDLNFRNNTVDRVIVWK